MLLGQDHFPDRVRYTLSPDEIGSGSLSSSAGEFRYTLQCRCDRAGDVLDLLFRDAASAGGEWSVLRMGNIGVGRLVDGSTSALLIVASLILVAIMIMVIIADFGHNC